MFQFAFALDVPICFSYSGHMTRNQPETQRQGATLRFVREQRGVTQQELATRLNISRAFLANIEAGRRALTPTIARTACDVLKIRPIVLVNDDFLHSDLKEQRS